jgi:hypothetical protein
VTDDDPQRVTGPPSGAPSGGVDGPQFGARQSTISVRERVSSALWLDGPLYAGQSAMRRVFFLVKKPRTRRRKDPVEGESSRACLGIGRPPEASLVGVESKRYDCGRPQIDLN